MHRESHLFLDLTVLPPSGEWTPNSPGWRFVQVHQGHGYLFAGSPVLPLDSGDVVVLPPLADGVFRASQLGEMTLEYFHVLPDLLTGLLTLAERRRLEARPSSSQARIHHLPSGSSLAQRFASLRALKGLANSLARRCQMLELAGTVFAEALTSNRSHRRRIASARDHFNALVQQMTEGEFLTHSAEELAARCGCSLRHFSRMFRRHAGISIRSKQSQMRLLKARQMLADTGDTVKRVAIVSGYRHLGLFNTMFKRQFGMTPSEWRERSRRRPEKAAGAPPSAA